MTLETITEIRSLLCQAMSDIGAACDRLRDLEESTAFPAIESESAAEIATWLSGSCDSLGEAALIAQGAADSYNPAVSPKEEAPALL